MPSQAEIDEYRSNLKLITALAVAETAKVVASVASDPAGQMETVLVAAIPVLLLPYMSAAAELAAVFYKNPSAVPPANPASAPSLPDLTALPGASPPARPVPRDLRLPPQGAPATQQPLPRRNPVPPIVGPTSRRAAAAAEAFQPRPAAPAPSSEIESSVRWSMRARTDPAAAESTVTSRLAGAVQRHVQNSARETITQNADLEGAKWYRHAQPDACAFCRMLATRGPDYLSAKSAQFVVGRRSKSRGGRPGELTGKLRGSRPIGELYHDDCGCVPVAVRAGEEYQPPDYVHDWLDQYLTAADKSNGSTKSILSEMRKLSDSKS